MHFINGDILGGAIHFAGGRVNYTRHILIQCSLANIQCAFYIGGDIAGGSFVGVWDTDQRGKVKNCVDIATQGTAELSVAHIAADNFDVIESWNGFQPPPEIKRVVARQCTDLMAPLQQQLHQV